MDYCSGQKSPCRTDTSVIGPVLLLLHQFLDRRMPGSCIADMHWTFVWRGVPMLAIQFSNGFHLVPWSIPVGTPAYDESRKTNAGSGTLPLGRRAPTPATAAFTSPAPR